MTLFSSYDGTVHLERRMINLNEFPSNRLVSVDSNKPIDSLGQCL